MRLAGGVLLLVAGLATGTAAVLLHEQWWCVPWVAVALLASMVAVGPGWTTRPPLALGFVVPVVLGAVRRPEGDYLVGTTTRGYLLLGLTGLLVIGTIVTLPRPCSRDRERVSS